jgi:hypothetical protein
MSNNNFGLIRNDDLIGFQPKMFGKRLNQFRIECERSAFENDWRLERGALSQATDGLASDGMQCRQRQVGLIGTLIEQGLNIGLGKHAAAPTDLVGLAATLSASIELLYRNQQELGNLVDKRTGAAGADPVHAHVGRDELL